MNEKYADIEFISHGDDHLIHAIPLRDWFAGQAVQVILATYETRAHEAAEKAYKLADAMMVARDKK